MLRRSAGFDVPDLLAAGPRDMLVPASGADVAREVLLAGGADRAGARPPGRAGPRRAAGRAARSPWPVGLILHFIRAGVGWAACPAASDAAARRAVTPGHRVAGQPARCVRHASRCHPGPGPRTPAMSAARGPGMPGGRPARPAARSPSSRTSRSNTVPPSRVASRRPGGKRRPPPLSRRRRAMAGRACSVWPANQRAPPSSSQAQRSSRREPDRAEDALQLPVVLHDHPPGIQGRGAQREHLARAGHVGGAAAQHGWREHVHLVAARPAGHVAASGRCGTQPDQRQAGMRQGRATGAACAGRRSGRRASAGTARPSAGR